MRKWFAFFIINLKMILLEKVVYLWTIILPVVLAIGQSAFLKEVEPVFFLHWFWVYIMISSFLNGVGLQLAELKEYGLLKTFTLVAGSKLYAIWGLIASQIVYSMISLSVFNIIVGSYYGVFSIKMILISYVGLLILSIPLSFLFLLIPLIPAKNSSMNTLLNLIMYPLFVVSISDVILKFGLSYVQLLNPFKLASEVMVLISSFFSLEIRVQQYTLLEMMLMVMLYLIIGIICIKKINLLSVIQRQ
ncbi:hypothetical protein [Longirhabdus pacifica]|uniref:hypothetical protein n=1 Tax=Longirhabdus pacifica TaxID=2305227 RepID=UPI00100875AD|nr:hypothetical protein [Longirhabdus pacifica]